MTPDGPRHHPTTQRGHALTTQPIHSPALGAYSQAEDMLHAVEATRDVLDLPTTSVAAADGAVLVTVATTCDLNAWLYELGGELRETELPAGSLLRSLYTKTLDRPRGAVAIHVHLVTVQGAA